MEGRFGGLVALITGGNSGLGLATARVLARGGAQVALAARRREQGEEAVALEYAGRGVRVNAVCPGLTMTDIVAHGFTEAPEKLAQFSARIPMGRPGRPEEIAHVVAWLCSAESSFMTAAAIPVDGGTRI